MIAENIGAASRQARLVIVDDHELMRAALRGLVEGERDLTVVGEAANGRAALTICRRVRPDLVLLDLRLPEMDGLEVLEALQQEVPGATILMLSLYEDPDTVARAIRVGAGGYLLKDAPLDDVIDGIHAALGGELVLDKRLARQILGRATREPPERASAPALLSEREREVLQLVAAGRTNREIGAALYLSRSTVKTHIEHILTKLGVGDRTHAAVRATELGLLGG